MVTPDIHNIIKKSLAVGKNLMFYLPRLIDINELFELIHEVHQKDLVFLDIHILESANKIKAILFMFGPNVSQISKFEVENFIHMITKESNLSDLKEEDLNSEGKEHEGIENDYKELTTITRKNSIESKNELNLVANPAKEVVTISPVCSGNGSIVKPTTPPVSETPISKLFNKSYLESKGKKVEEITKEISSILKLQSTKEIAKETVKEEAKEVETVKTTEKEKEESDIKAKLDIPKEETENPKESEKEKEKEQIVEPPFEEFIISSTNPYNEVASKTKKSDSIDLGRALSDKESESMKSLLKVYSVIGVKKFFEGMIKYKEKFESEDLKKKFKLYIPKGGKTQELLNFFLNEILTEKQISRMNI